MKIGKALKFLREEKQISQREMASMLGVTPVSLWRIESDKIWPRKRILDTFCEKTGIPMARLITLSLTEEDY